MARSEPCLHQNGISSSSSSSSFSSSFSSSSLNNKEEEEEEEEEKTEERDQEEWRAFERCVTSFVKAFSIGVGLRGGLSLFSILTRRKKKQLKGKADLPVADLYKSVLKEALRYGLFLGSFAGTFATCDEIVSAIGGFKRTAPWRALVAGAIAGPSLLLTGPGVQHTSMAIYIFLRAAVLAARCGIKSEQYGWLFRPLAWKHGDTALMCLSSSQILSAWILKPTSLPSSYISFLNKHGGKDTSIIKTLRELAFRNKLTHLETVKGYYKSMGMNAEIDPNLSIPCSVVHGSQGCVSHFMSFLSQAYLRSLPVYVPVYLIPAIIVHRQAILKKPLPILSKTLLGTARSSLFLSVYCASAWFWTCMLFRTSGKCTPPLIALGTLPAGLAVMIEKKTRRMEIGLYCFARALESFAICFSDADFMTPTKVKLKMPKRVDVVLFSVATSIIMHCYAQEREVFRSKYLNVLDWIFGIPHDPPILQPPLVKVSSLLKFTQL